MNTICARCGEFKVRGGRCQCGAGRTSPRTDRAWSQRAWATMSKRRIAEHRAQHGDVCHGFGRASHRTADLTLDHVTPMTQGGALLGPTQVLCRGCNTRKMHADRRLAR